MTKSNYYIDFEKFSLIKLRTIIEQSELSSYTKINDTLCFYKHLIMRILNFLQR